MAIGRFLAGIFALVWSPAHEKYLILQRSAEKDHAAGMWDCVTGRVDQGEGFFEALQREALEEISVEIQFEFMLGSVHFYRGPKTPEYEMVGVVCFCTLADPQKIQISPEHSQYRWVTPAEADSLYAADKSSMRFLISVIHRAERMRSFMPSELQEYLRETGMDIHIDRPDSD